MTTKHATLPANVSPSNEPATFTARRFRTSPSGVFVDEVVAHIKKTAQPETYQALYHGKIPPSAKYRIIRKIDIDGKKRPNSDMAPCPMCTPNRFLSGALVWLYDMQVCAIIGHCCAEHADEAEREFKRNEERRHQEDYLLASLPHLDEKKRVLKALNGPAKEALRIYRKFRKECSHLQHHLRRLTKLGGGRLYVVETLRGAEKEDDTPSDYFGPAGFGGRGRSNIETRDHDLGQIIGGTALLSTYNPLKDLTHIIRLVESFDFTGDEARAIDFIADMSPQQRRAAVAIFQEIDRHYSKFILRLTDFLSFFDLKNIEALHRYGTHPLNDFPFEAHHDYWNNYPRVRFRQRGKDSSIIVGLSVDGLNFRWEAPPLKK